MFYVEEGIDDGKGFNRNIVECKLKVRKPRFGKVERFNRNIVECKYVYAGKWFECSYRFNRNIVECKWQYNAGSSQVS